MGFLDKAAAKAKEELTKAVDALDGSKDHDMPTSASEPAPEAHPADPTAPQDMPDPEEPTTEPLVDPSDRATYPHEPGADPRIDPTSRPDIDPTTEVFPDEPLLPDEDPDD